MDGPNLLPRLLPDSSNLLAVTSNQAQNIEPTFEIIGRATSFNGENLSTHLPVIMDDHCFFPQLFSDSSLIVLDDRDLMPQLLPDTLGPFVNGTQSSYLTPSMEHLIPKGVNTLLQDQDLTTMSGFVQWNNQEPFQPNTNFNGHQSSSYVPFVQENPVDARARIDTGISIRQFMTNQISLSPHLLNYYINPHMTWDSQGSPKQFSTLLHRDIHDSGFLNIFDIQSRHCVPPVFQTYPSYTSKPTLVSMPPNLYDNQHDYIPMFPEPYVSSRYDNHYNQYHSQAMMPNGHVEQGAGSLLQLSGGSMQVLDQRNDVNNQSSTVYEHTSLSPNLTGPQVIGSRITGLSGFRTIEGTSSQVRLSEATRLLRYDNRNNQYHSQAMVPHGHVEQGAGNSMQLLLGGSTRILNQGNDEQNQLLDALSLQGQGSAMYQLPTTLPSSLPSLQATGSRNMGLLGFGMNDRTSSQVQVSDTADLLRHERASTLQLQQVARVSANRPTMWKYWKGKDGQEYQPPRRGRPRKRLEVGESSSCPKHRKIEKDSLERESAGTTHVPQEGNNNPENVRNEVQNINPTNPSPAASSPREIANGLYGVTFARNGVPPDPHLRLFIAPPEK